RAPPSSTLFPYTTLFRSLRGGSESLESNRAIAASVRAGLADARLPQAAVQLVDTADRAAVGELITMNDYVDIIVPRGGKSLIERSEEHTSELQSRENLVC